MRKEILDALTTKFAGVSATILGRIADKLVKTATTAEQVKTAVDGVTFQQVLESYGDSRATEATQTAVANYEKKHGLKDGIKVDGGAPKLEQNQTYLNKGSDDPDKQKPAGGGDDLAKAIAAAVAAAVKPLQDDIANFKQGRAADARKQQLSEIVGKLPEPFRKVYERIPVDTMTDDEFNAFKEETGKEVDAIASEMKSKGAVFGRPGARAGNQGNDKLTKEQLEAIGKRGGIAAADQQPF